MIARIVVVCSVLFGVLELQAASWRTFAGSFGSRWNTLGHHGHDQPLCDAAAGCDGIDFARANLDDSIGFRVGRERDFFESGPLRLVGGADASVSHTEYNLSQRDFSLVSAALFAGTDIEIGGVRIGARYGGGAYTATATEHRGLMRFLDLTAGFPLGRGAAVRIGRRNFALSRMEAAPSRDISVMIVTDGVTPGESNWEFTAATGTAMPGAGAGGDRKLRSTALNRTAALRTLRQPDWQLEVSWTSTAHESSIPSTFRGYDGNFRSKTIESYGVGLSRLHPLSRRLFVRLSGGVEIADWRDEHRLLTRDGAELVAGVELAVAAGASLRLQLQPRLAIESSLQKTYWRTLDLGEARWTMGIVLTR